MSEEPIMNEALATYGIEMQLRKLQEEMYELGIEVLKFLNGDINVEKLANEAADVDVCIASMRIYMDKISDGAFSEHYDVAKVYKMNRLGVRVRHRRIK